MNTWLLMYGAFVALSKMQSSNITLDSADWESFKLEHGKQYENEQVEAMRRAIFTYNNHYINEFNAHKSAELGFTLGINKYLDISQIERELGYKRPAVDPQEMTKSTEEGRRFLDQILAKAAAEGVPDEMDWRKVRGRVSQVRDSGNCIFASWAFAAVDLLESQELVSNSSQWRFPKKLSVQELMDCTFDSVSCDSGILFSALDFVVEHGIQSDLSYPFENQGRTCRANFDKSIFRVKSRQMVDMYDEEKLKQVVGTYGPVTATIDGKTPAFASYKGGILADPQCDRDPINLFHSVLIVGYGTDSKGTDYWIIKNSVGPSWGMDGYGYIVRHQNECGISSQNFFVTH